MAAAFVDLVTAASDRDEGDIHGDGQLDESEATTLWEDLKIRDILTADAIDNGIKCDMAIGGSTNAIVHILAMAGRA
ncbi:MAG: hypothetical protein HC782_04855, partial [Gammaproteobacteria bacterium]|nr:hypothetical protein [Gammaproteobacteria bacterium]